MNTLQDALVFVFNADEHELKRLQMAVTERSRQIRTERKHEALATFQTGDRVELQGLSPKYLNGTTGTILRIEGTRFAVTLDHQVGKYHGVIRIPASAVKEAS